MNPSRVAEILAGACRTHAELYTESARTLHHLADVLGANRRRITEADLPLVQGLGESVVTHLTAAAREVKAASDLIQELERVTRAG